MKRIITIILTFTLIFSSLAISTFAASSSGGKYIRVKKTTYQKYKKAYNEQKQLKKQLKTAKSQLNALRRENESLQNELEEKNGLNSWTWMSIKSLGLSYDNKEWTIPSEFPSTFMINGTTYTVRRQE